MFLRFHNLITPIPILLSNKTFVVTTVILLLYSSHIFKTHFLLPFSSNRLMVTCDLVLVKSPFELCADFESIPRQASTCRGCRWPLMYLYIVYSVFCCVTTSHQRARRPRVHFQAAGRPPLIFHLIGTASMSISAAVLNNNANFETSTCNGYRILNTLFPHIYTNGKRCSSLSSNSQANTKIQIALSIELHSHVPTNESTYQLLCTGDFFKITKKAPLILGAASRCMPPVIFELPGGLPRVEEAWNFALGKLWYVMLAGPTTSHYVMVVAMKLNLDLKVITRRIFALAMNRFNQHFHYPTIKKYGIINIDRLSIVRLCKNARRCKAIKLDQE